MKFSDFKSTFKNYPVFKSNQFIHLTDDLPTLRRQLTEWCDKGKVIQLRRGMYTLTDEDRAVEFSRFFLANQLYSPSYISLESALSFYNMIPEAVHAITSISSKKTQAFENEYGVFRYYHIKVNAFGSYISTKDEFGNKFFIATKERALVDFLYLRTRGLKKFDASIFTENYRLQNLSDLNVDQLLKNTRLFSQKKLLELVMLLIESVGQ